MDITHFVFAFYVFLLVCVTIWFYARVTRGSKKKDGGAQEKEQHLFKLYQNIEDMLGGFEEYAEEAKAAIDERLKQAETLIAQAQAIAKSAKVSETEKPSFLQDSPERGTVDIRPEPERQSVPETPVVKEGTPKPKTAEKKQAAGRRAAEPQETKPVQEERSEVKPPQKAGRSVEKTRQNVDELIPQYVAQGMRKQEIARALGISTREVSLIMEVKKIGVPDNRS